MLKKSNGKKSVWSFKNGRKHVNYYVYAGPGPLVCGPSVFEASTRSAILHRHVFHRYLLHFNGNFFGYYLRSMSGPLGDERAVTPCMSIYID